MSDIKEKLTLLIALQEKDCAIDKLRQQAAVIPETIKEIRDSFALMKTESEENKKMLTQLQLRRKEKEMELTMKEADIRKHGTELNAVKSNDAYRALLAEIENGKKAKSDLESEILELMEKIDAEAVRVKEHEKSLKQREAEIQANIAGLEDELKKKQADIQQGENERNEFSRGIPEEILRRYEYIRESKGGMAVVSIEGDSCAGCHTVLRPAVINEVFKDQEFVVCDSCSRILFKKHED
jgi:predicted  nucleic acid-binding Zn-ribbon protein